MGNKEPYLGPLPNQVDFIDKKESLTSRLSELATVGILTSMAGGSFLGLLYGFARKADDYTRAVTSLYCLGFFGLMKGMTKTIEIVKQDRNSLEYVSNHLEKYLDINGNANPQNRRI